MDFRDSDLFDDKKLLVRINTLNKMIKKRRERKKDCDIIFKWQSNMNTRRYSRNKISPSYEEHAKWFHDALLDPSRYLFMVSINDVPVSVLRLDQLEGQNEYEVSIFVDPDKYGNEFGSVALEFARKLFPKAMLFAHVMPENIASNKLFKKMGYKNEKNDYYLSVPKNNLN